MNHCGEFCNSASVLMNTNSNTVAHQASFIVYSHKFTCIVIEEGYATAEQENDQVEEALYKKQNIRS